MIRHIIWDFDGTLFDTYPMMAGALVDALAELGISETYDDVVAYFMDSERVALDHYAEKYAIADLDARYRERRRNGDLSLVRPFPGADEVCRAIRGAGLHSYILTHRNHTANDIIALCGMEGLFDEVVTTDYGFARKPDPQGALYLMERHGMLPEETMIVGDRDIEIEMGKRAGIASCFFRNGTSRTALTPDYTISALEELMDILGC